MDDLRTVCGDSVLIHTSVVLVLTPSILHTGEEPKRGCEGTAKAAAKQCSLPSTQSRPIYWTGYGHAYPCP